MIIKKPLTVTVILLFISVSVIPSTSTTVEESSTVSFDSKTHYVGGNGTGNYTKIQDAIDNASDGDTVFVYNDSSPYYENIVVDKSINLIGEGRDTTVIDGVGEGEVVGLNGLAYHPTTDKLYGASSYSFYEIDMDSGLQTYIGDFNTGGLMIAISFDNTGDCYGVDIGTDSLYSIDIGTGEASLIDSLGINLNYAQDCAYDRDNDIFYLSAYSVEADDRGVDDDRAPGELISRNGGELYICDTGTANLTLVGTFENGAEITGFAIPYTQGEELDRRFGLNMLTNEINYRGLSYEPFYGYCAYVPGGQMTDYTIYFNSDSPENLTTIAYTQSDDFIAGGTWANTTWYGVEYSTGRLYTIGPDTGDMDAIGDVVTVSADWVNLSGFTITNSGYYPFDGIDVRSNFNTINDSTIMNNRNGIILHCSSNNTLIGNNISNNSYGIKSYSSSNNTLIGNNISNNGHWYYRGGGIYLGYSSSNAITDNNISSNNRDGIHLDWYSSNNAITDNNISSNNRDGIHLYDSHSNTITGNNISSNNHNGIYIYGSADDNTINGNTISNNWNGIYLDWYSSSNTITGNNISNNDDGIYLDWYSSNNAITDNNISSNNNSGIFLHDSGNNNDIIGNTISSNDDGIVISSGSNNNHLYHNNLIDNIHYVNAYDECDNTWDNGYPTGGNYWDDYSGDDTNGDGIGDIPYNISGGDNQDRYPLMYPFEMYYILNISAPSQVDEETTFNVTIKSMGGTVIPGALVEFRHEVKVTDFNGIAQFTAPTVENDTLFWINATKEGYTSDSETILVKDVSAEFESFFMFGRIINLNITGEYITFNAVKVWLVRFSPFQFLKLTSGEKVSILKSYEGLLGDLFGWQFILAKCDAFIG